MAVDGSLKFDTKIDTNGFNKGVGGIKQSCNSMMSSIKKLGTAIGIAFGIGAIVQLSKAGVQANNEYENSLIGLQSVVEGNGRSFEKAKSFIRDYTSDGLIYATDAITSYKNLLARGYNDEQIQKVMLAFKNSATYGRQAALSHGEAVKSATEGIKNENSILVDNAGVTKNVSMMWKDYAKSIGVGVDSLTKQQKIQAEVQGIMEETKYMMGDAAKAAGTFSGSISILKNSMIEMKRAYGAFLQPILSAVIPIINQAILALTRFFNMLAQISSLLFGKKVFAADQAKEQEKATGGTVENETALGKAADKTNKKLKEQTSGLDEINTLSQEVADGSGGIDIGSVGSENQTTDNSNELGGNIEISPKVQEFVDKIKVMLEPLQDISFDKLQKSLERLYKAFTPFTKSLFSGLEWGIKNIFAPLSKFVIEEVLPRYLDILAIAVDGLGTVFDETIKNFQLFFNIFLKPLSDYAAPKFLEFLDEFKTKLGELVQMLKTSEAFNDFRDILTKIFERLAPLYETLVDVAAWFANFKLNKVFLDLEYKFKNLEDAIGLVASVLNLDFSGAWEHFKNLMIDNKIDKAKEDLNLLKEKFTELKEIVVGFVEEWVTQISEMFNEWKTKIAEWWEKDVTPWFNLEKWKELAFNIGKAIGEAWISFVAFWTAEVPKWWSNDVMPWFTISKWKGIFDNIIKSLSQFWKSFSSSWGKAITDWWNNDVLPWFTVEKWVELGKNIIDGIVDGFKSGLSFLGELWDSFTGGFNVGVSSNENYSRQVSYKMPQIPALARGAVIPPNKQFMAVLGDQKHGTNIEAPLDTILQAFNMANANNQNNALLEKMIDLLGGILAKDTTVNLDGNEIGRTADNWKNNRGFNTSKGAFSNAY